MESRPRSFSQARISFGKDDQDRGRSSQKGDLLFLSAAKEKKKKKAVRRRGGWGPRLRECQGMGQRLRGAYWPRNKRCFEASPCRGMTRRLRRGSRACSPVGRSHFSFGGERKVCKRKPAARRLREKGFHCPFCRRGSQRRARHSWRVISCVRARSCARLFPPSK